MESFGYKLTFDGTIWFRVEIPKWLKGEPDKLHLWLSAVVTGIQACGNRLAEYDDCLSYDIFLPHITLST